MLQRNSLADWNQDSPARTFNHVALSCVDIDALVEWWTQVLGFEIISPIRHLTRETNPDHFNYTFCSYPQEMRELKFAILTSGNGIGIELFQFVDPTPKQRDESFEYSRVGYFHICVTDPDPEKLLQKVIARGGKQLGGWMDYSRYGHRGHKGVYMQDPWGNLIECMSLSIERVCSAANALGWYIQEQQKQRDREAPAPSL